MIDHRAHEHETSDVETLPEIYYHTRGPQWGLSIVVWERDDKRRLQFQDGSQRTFKRGYYHLLEELDPPADEYDFMRTLEPEHLKQLVARVRTDDSGSEFEAA